LTIVHPVRAIRKGYGGRGCLSCLCYRQPSADGGLRPRRAEIGPRVPRRSLAQCLALEVLPLPVPDLLLGLQPPPRATEAPMVLLRRGAILLAQSIFLARLHLRTTRCR
jgi:hypothetical protein